MCAPLWVFQNFKVCSAPHTHCLSALQHQACRDGGQWYSHKRAGQADNAESDDESEEEQEQIEEAYSDDDQEALVTITEGFDPTSETRSYHSSSDEEGEEKEVKRKSGVDLLPASSKRAEAKAKSRAKAKAEKAEAKKSRSMETPAERRRAKEYEARKRQKKFDKERERNGGEIPRYSKSSKGKPGKKGGKPTKGKRK